MQTPPIVSPEEWQEAWEHMLVKEILAMAVGAAAVTDVARRSDGGRRQRRNSCDHV